SKKMLRMRSPVLSPALNMLPEVSTTFEGQFVQDKKSGAAEPETLPALVESFNQSVSQKQFDLADQLAKEAKEQAPQSQVADLMLYKAKLAKTLTDERRDRESLVVTDSEYPNLLRWKAQKRLAQMPAPGTEAYEPIVENPFLSAYEAPLSTF